MQGWFGSGSKGVCVNAGCWDEIGGQAGEGWGAGRRPTRQLPACSVEFAASSYGRLSCTYPPSKMCKTCRNISPLVLSPCSDGAGHWPVGPPGGPADRHPRPGHLLGAAAGRGQRQRCWRGQPGWRLGDPGGAQRRPWRQQPLTLAAAGRRRLRAAACVRTAGTADAGPGEGRGTGGAAPEVSLWPGGEWWLGGRW